MKLILDRLDERDVCNNVVTFLFPLRHQIILRVSKLETCHRVAHVGRAKSDCSKGNAPSRSVSRAKEE